ncbi:MAG TPA: tRNA epoxyqueuosine(34) reductase QueG, partial [Firmicutes bacterium]|nr:tRNA epoxyqueuosine(34) reductase QueG [Bacillota bacterium]
MLTSLTKEGIEARAKELGADKIGIVRAEPLNAEAEDLRQWLQSGYHGTMSWMAKKRDVRDDPGKLLKGCKSIIVIAVNYYTPHLHLRFPNFPRISRYAWGRDYHEVLRKILHKLETELDEEARERGIFSAKYRIVVDTAPFRDKVWAQRAGIGWIGKNSCLITREFGSWVFIGSILTTLELESTTDKPHENHCGNCTRCIKACPTGALVAEGKLDARACLSYLTIEHPGEIPEDFKENMDGWVFGCDTCQDVCPWNRFAKNARLTQFDPKPGLQVPDLHLLSHMSIDDYDQLVQGTSLKRA